MVNITKMNIPECTFAESRFKKTQIEANGYSMAIIIKTWPQCSINAQNVAKMTAVWQSCSKCGKHAQSVAIIIKTWQTWPQYGNHNQNVANMPKEWQS